jgi:hypothetical protein
MYAVLPTNCWPATPDVLANNTRVASSQAGTRARTADVLASTSGTTQVITGDRPLFRFLRDRVVVPLMNLPLCNG